MRTFEQAVDKLVRELDDQYLSVYSMLQRDQLVTNLEAQLALLTKVTAEVQGTHGGERQVFRNILRTGLAGYIKSAPFGGADRDDWRQTLWMISQVVVGKQRDYGHGNISKFGTFGIIVRLSDKIERLKNLYGTNRDAINESLGDTWLDVVGYGMIGMMWLDESFMLPLRADASDYEMPVQVTGAHEHNAYKVAG